MDLEHVVGLPEETGIVSASSTAVEGHRGDQPFPGRNLRRRHFSNATRDGVHTIIKIIKAFLPACTPGGIALERWDHNILNRRTWCSESLQPSASSLLGS